MPFVEGVPTVVVQLDKPRELGFTMGAMRRVQQLGVPEMQRDATGALLAIPAYVWACLDAEGRRELTVEQVEEMVHPGNLGAISTALNALFGASNPEVADGAGDTQDPTRAGPHLATG